MDVTMKLPLVPAKTRLNLGILITKMEKEVQELELGFLMLEKVPRNSQEWSFL
jgi:hypothetical protein